MESVQNYNFLSPLNFEFQIKGAPHVSYFIQKLRLPDVSLNSTGGQPNPFINIPIQGDHLSFNELEIVFKVDEDMNNYKQIFSWLLGMGFNIDHTQFKELNTNVNLPHNITSDVSLLVYNSAKQLNQTITFIDAYPIFLGNMDYTTVDNTVNYMNCTARFKYKDFSFN